MPKLPVKKVGVATVSTKAQTKGAISAVIKDEEKTEVLGPFTVEAVHAEVEANVRLTLSENYQSVTVGVSVRIPVDPNNEAVQEGLDYCFDKANTFVEQETNGAREVLKQVTGR